MALHPQTVRYLQELTSWRMIADQEPTVEELRRVVARQEPLRAAGRELPYVADALVRGPGGEIPVRIYRPERRPRRPLPALIYFHGGGWVLGGVDGVDPLCRDLAVEAGCVIVNVGYRLAPEHPFPAAVEDAWAVTADVVRRPQRYAADPRAVAVAGDSAGGNLAAVVARLARDRDLPLAHQLLIYPATDTAMDTPSYREFGDGYGLDAGSMARFTELYAGAADRRDPRLAPLRAPDLSRLASATVVTAECDVLRDEGEAYARRLADAGVEVAHRRFDGMVHSFFLLPEVFDAGMDARRWTVHRLRSVLGAAIRLPGDEGNATWADTARTSA